MTIAVVVPALDECDRIPDTLEALVGGASASRLGNDLEVVVVDGGSRDGTPDLARAHGARVVPSAPGRARQLQAGLDAVAGDTVVFLHADTRMPAGWDGAVAAALADPACSGGAFRFAFDRAGASPADQRSLRWIETSARIRSRLFGLPYGDQAIFARRSALDAIGGVPQANLLEDLDLVSRLKRRGRFVLLPLEVATSPRRYLECGVLRTSIRHGMALLAWLLGTPRAGLASRIGR